MGEEARLAESRKTMANMRSDFDKQLAASVQEAQDNEKKAKKDKLKDAMRALEEAKSENDQLKIRQRALEKAKSEKK